MKNHIEDLQSLYHLKIKQQETLENYLSASIKRKRGRNENYQSDLQEIALVRARKQCYIQTEVDLDSLLDHN